MLCLIEYYVVFLEEWSVQSLYLEFIISFKLQFIFYFYPNWEVNKYYTHSYYPYDQNICIKLLTVCQSIKKFNLMHFFKFIFFCKFFFMIPLTKNCLGFMGGELYFYKLPFLNSGLSLNSIRSVCRQLTIRVLGMYPE